MKKHLILSILVTICIIGFLIIGNYLDSESMVEGVAIVEAPEAVIWNHLIDFNGYNKWCDRISIRNIYRDSLKNTIEYDIYYMIPPGSLQWMEKAEIKADLHSLLCLPQKKKCYSFLKNIFTQIGTKKLADGSIEVRWQIHYSVRPILARILNNFVIRPRFCHILSSSLSNFKIYIER